MWLDGPLSSFTDPNPQQILKPPIQPSIPTTRSAHLPLSLIHLPSPQISVKPNASPSIMTTQLLTHLYIYRTHLITPSSNQQPFLFAISLSLTAFLLRRHGSFASAEGALRAILRRSSRYTRLEAEREAVQAPSRATSSARFWELAPSGRRSQPSKSDRSREAVRRHLALEDGPTEPCRRLVTRPRQRSAPHSGMFVCTL